MTSRFQLTMALAATLLLGACGTHHAMHHGPAGAQLHVRPLITVNRDILSIAPEPLVMQPGQDDIVWRVPRGYSFPANGITVKGRLLDKDRKPVRPSQAAVTAAGELDVEAARAFACSIDAADKQQFRCRVDPKLKPGGVYRYFIRVQVDGSSQVLEWDPNIFHPE
jgi:hypothetical protein